MSSLPNNSSSFLNRLNIMFLLYLMHMLHVQDPDNQFTDDDFIYDKEEEKLEFEIEDDKLCPYQDEGLRAIYQEESRIEADVIYRILNGKAHTLKPNSGQTIMIRESSIAVEFRVDEEGEHIVWEWHGHIPRYTEEHKFSLEYIYGNYFQRIVHEEGHTTPPRVVAAKL